MVWCNNTFVLAPVSTSGVRPFTLVRISHARRGSIKHGSIGFCLFESCCSNRDVRIVMSWCCGTCIILDYTCTSSSQITIRSTLHMPARGGAFPNVLDFWEAPIICRTLFDIGIVFSVRTASCSVPEQVLMTSATGPLHVHQYVI